MISSGQLGTIAGSGFESFLRTLYPDQSERHEGSLWSSHEVRWLRYDYLWSFYDQRIYAGYLSQAMKVDQGLYRNIRPIFNRIRQVAEFNVAHLMGGRIDNYAGDGTSSPTALPIIRGK